MSRTGSYTGGSTIIHTGRPRAAHTRAAKKREEQKKIDKKRYEAALKKYNLLKHLGTQLVSAEDIPPKHNSKAVRKRNSLSRSKKKRVQKPPRNNNHDVFFAQLKEWTRMRISANINNNLAPFPPRKLLAYIKDHESELIGLLIDKGTVKVNHETKKNIVEVLKALFFINSAIFYVENQTILAIPSTLQNALSDAEVQEFKSGLEKSHFFSETVKKHERRKKVGNAKDEAQRKKMANVVVEIKRPSSKLSI